MISKVFIDRPKFAIVISVVMVLAGTICLFKMPVAEYPEVAPPTIVVNASYPGASAQVIADTVAAPIESEINGVEDLIYYSSQSDNSGNYSLSITFKSGIDSDMAQVNVQNAIQRAEPSLPQEVKALGVNVYKRSGDILGMLAFTSENGKLSKLFMSNYVSMNVKDALARIDGVSQAVIWGELNYSMRLWLDPLRMTALGVTHEDVKNAISTQNIQAAAGAVGTEESSEFMQYKLNAEGRLKEVGDFEQIIVKSGSDGRQIRLSDIARIELGAETYNGTNYFNGEPCVMMALFRNNDANAVAVIDNIKSEMAKLAQNFPEGLSWHLGYDSTEFVRITMEEIVVTLILTFVLVVAITYIFLQDWRATLIPSITIPVSLLGTFIFLYPMGFSANVLTMFALILVIGSVVDDAIVVVENCMRLIEEEHLSPYEAAVKGMGQITGAVIATTLVILAIYAPVAFYGGMVGTIYKQFAVTMCIALVLSSVNALTLSPALCAIVLRPQKQARGPFKWFNIGLNFSRDGYVSLSGILVRRGLLTAILFAGVLYLNYHLFNKVPTSFLPDEDKGAIFCDVQLAPGSTLYRTGQALGKISGIIRGIDGVKDMLVISGHSMTAGSGENVGMVIVVLKDWSERKTPELQVKYIQQQIMQKCATIPEANVRAFLPPAIIGLGATGGVSFALQATGDQTPQELAQAVRSLIGQIMATGKAVYATSSFEANTPQLELVIDRAKAEALNIPVSRIFGTLQSQLAAYYINDFNLNGYTFQVKMQADSDYRKNINMIEQLNVQTDAGQMVPLSTIAQLKWITGPRQIERFNQFSSASMNTQSLPSVSSGEMMNTVQQLVNDTLPKDYQISWTDMSYQEQNNQGQIIYLMALALIFGYLFLVAQYESWTVPISVILSVAVATLGAMVALLVTDMPLSIYCQLGLIMLIGLASKNAILMVEFSKQEREAGRTIEEAALNGARTRFRAVMMTALSFVIGVFPMVIASGAGAGSRRAIGVTTFWGMVAATAVGIFFIPALYAFFQRGREALQRLRGTHPDGKTQR
ncbi:efflux RND transporter permease subunit [Victivallis sp. Marseille-Q1083]|uniref:efflux RND transporter permease subunit n=1 Tax=Victivallis sp. Marseille-Q1083 TaxID=2717288 RepID=UPI00158A6C52|nr:efflux RND transporter permease subunit [Victivallis sp. Marseille-Q1083]